MLELGWWERSWLNLYDRYDHRESTLIWFFCFCVGVVYSGAWIWCLWCHTVRCGYTLRVTSQTSRLYVVHFFSTVGMADCVLVNSNFTAQTFFKTFTSLTNTNPRVLYPSLNFKAYDAEIDLCDSIEGIPSIAKVVFLSINRFERKKNLQLALKALGNLKSKISSEEWKTSHLVMAGMQCLICYLSIGQTKREFS